MLTDRILEVTVKMGGVLSCHLSAQITDYLFIICLILDYCTALTTLVPSDLSLMTVFSFSRSYTTTREALQSTTFLALKCSVTAAGTLQSATEYYDGCNPSIKAGFCNRAYK